MTPGPMSGTGPLDAPPPAPGPMGNTPNNPAGGGSPPGLAGLAQPAAIGSAQMPPEVLTGIVQACDKIAGMFDSFAQVTPDLAADWDMLKQLLQRALGKVLASGGGPTSATAPGGQFPGGGQDAGKTGTSPM